MKRLDSRFHGNDKIVCILTFYETVKIIAPKGEFVNGRGFSYLGEGYLLKFIDDAGLKSGKLPKAAPLRYILCRNGWKMGVDSLLKV